MNKKIIFICILVLIITGCNNLQKEYISPEKYYSMIELKIINNDLENSYVLECYHYNDKNKIIVKKDELMEWEILSDGINCRLTNSKFQNSSIKINNIQILDELLYDLDLSKFERIVYNNLKKMEYYNNGLKYILELDKKTLLPASIKVYKDDEILKVYNFLLFDIKRGTEVKYNLNDDILVN